MADRMLNTVDEHGAIVGEATREEIHRHGLLHREVHVWFYTSRGEIIFQLRAEKDTFAGLFDSTVGGHVEIGSDYETTAFNEMREETGIQVAKDRLAFVSHARIDESDPATATRNNVIRAIYTYCYDGPVTGLTVEEGEGAGFESWPLDRLLRINEQDRKRFIAGVLDNEVPMVASAIRKR